MYRLLIVEDEKNTREGLRDCVDWASYNIKVVKEASNGLEALSFLLENSADIVLTDVVMPLMDGIELVRQIRQRNITSKIVFVSGYWDMPYLKSAFELDAIDYILKPIKLSELDKVIRKVIKMCEQEREEKERIQKMRNKLEASMPLLREKFIGELLNGIYHDKDVIEQRMRFMEIPFFDNGYYTVMTLRIISKMDWENATDIEKHEFQCVIIKDIIESTLDSSYKIFCLVMNEQRISVILNSKHSISYDQIISIAQGIQENIHVATNIQVSIGIGEEVQSVELLKISYQKSLYALEQEYFLGEGQIIHYRDIDINYNIPDCYPHHLQEKIFSAVRLGKEQELKNLIHRFFREIEICAGMNIEYVQTMCIELIVLIQKFLLESNNIRLNIGQRKDLWKKILKLKTLRQTEEWMSNLLSAMAKQIADMQNQRSKRIIENIKRFVQEHFKDNITVQTLAEKFYYTPNYISMLFKKETGENFKEYLTRVRIEKAKDLMKDPSLKLYQIAEGVGYNDPDYFAKVFKKYTGITPTEYRERLD